MLEKIINKLFLLRLEIKNDSWSQLRLLVNLEWQNLKKVCERSNRIGFN